MTTFILQLIAMVTMFCDHVGSIFLDNALIFRCIGRFAFPIYAFLVVEGYRHIKKDPERIKVHIGGYLVLAVLSEFCYDFAECQTLDMVSFMSSQNAIITLLLGFLGLIAIDMWKNTNKLYMWSAIALTAMVNFLVLSNYKFAGVLLMYALYFYLNRYENKSYIRRFAFLLAIFACYLLIYHWSRYNFCGLDMYINKLLGINKWWYLTHILIAGLLATYNGKKGYSSKKFKLIYRNFYPAHLFILGLFRHVFFKV
ncbi:MAG: TraX family protein [Clostridium sp.]